MNIQDYVLSSYLEVEVVPRHAAELLGGVLEGAVVGAGPLGVPSKRVALEARACGHLRGQATRPVAQGSGPRLRSDVEEGGPSKKAKLSALVITAGTNMYI